MRYYVAGRKPEILVESGKAPLEAFVRQTHLPGHEAEVDFGDVTVRLGGELVTCYLFSFRLSYSGKAVHLVFASCGQEAFFEGHVHALRTLGGVPRSKVRYDNLKAAVSRVLGQSRGRVEADRWIAFRLHFVHVPVVSPPHHGCVSDLDGCVIWGFGSRGHDRVIAARFSEILKSSQLSWRSRWIAEGEGRDGTGRRARSAA
ncbi:hypothetical protein ABZS61_23340 [Streptomyces sp. NPDC005566]|uniref:hypothetical protein n=1 Tax=Streptomyces sp. NPDC005566 TaxID=3156886 RepID=UPI0033B814C7